MSKISRMISIILFIIINSAYFTSAILPCSCDGDFYYYGTGSIPVFINEIHYDNFGADVNEFVEIAGPAGTDLTGWKLILYNANDGTVYNTLTLSGVIPHQGGGFGTQSFSFPSNGIQNGAPDGLALVRSDDVVIQLLSYEGTFTATNGPAAGMTAVDIGVLENPSPVGQSLQLQGTGNSYEQFTWQPPRTATPGAINTNQVFTGL